MLLQKARQFGCHVWRIAGLFVRVPLRVARTRMPLWKWAVLSAAAVALVVAAWWGYWFIGGFFYVDYGDVATVVVTEPDGTRTSYLARGIPSVGRWYWCPRDRCEITLYRYLNMPTWNDAKQLLKNTDRIYRHLYPYFHRPLGSSIAMWNEAGKAWGSITEEVPELGTAEYGGVDEMGPIVYPPIRREMVLGTTQLSSYMRAVGLNIDLMSGYDWQTYPWLGVLTHEMVHTFNIMDESTTEIITWESLAARSNRGVLTARMALANEFGGAVMTYLWAVTETPYIPALAVANWYTQPCSYLVPQIRSELPEYARDENCTTFYYHMDEFTLWVNNVIGMITYGKRRHDYQRLRESLVAGDVSATAYREHRQRLYDRYVDDGRRRWIRMAYGVKPFVWAYRWALRGEEVKLPSGFIWGCLCGTCFDEIPVWLDDLAYFIANADDFALEAARQFPRTCPRGQIMVHVDNPQHEWVCTPLEVWNRGGWKR